MTNSFFAFISRMKYINRWGLMRNSRYESLAEHSFETAYIANALANIENSMFGGSFNADRITALALFHDCPEIITGDMPTPVKYKSERMKSAYADTEKDAVDTLLSSMPENLRDVYRENITGGTKEERQIIKAADKISALVKCLEEINAGNGDFKSALDATEKKLADCPFESVKYFTANIIPQYSMTLDELSE